MPLDLDPPHAPPPARRVRAAALACAAAIAALTLAPAGDAARPDDWRCVACGEAGLSDFAGNVLLFVPLGALLVRAGARGPAAAALGALFSLAVELAQAAGIPGRSAALGDLLANAGGAAVGAAVAAHWAWLARPPRRAAWGLAATAGGAWLALAAAGVWLLGRDPAAGLTPPQAGLLAYAPGFGYFSGQVQSVTVDGWTAPAQTGRGPALVGAATARDLAAAVAITGGDGRPSLVPALFVHDALGRGQLLVGQRGGDAVARVRLRAAWWRLRAPELVLPGALLAHRQGAPPASARLAAGLRGDTLRLLVEAGGAERRVAARLTPGTTWQLLPVPRRWGPDRRAVAALWLAATLAPFGYWLARTARAKGGERQAVGAAVLALAVVALGLWAVPAAAGHDAAPWWEWAGSAAGVAVGVAARRRRRAGRVRLPELTAPRSPERRVAARPGPRQLSRP